MSPNPAAPTNSIASSPVNDAHLMRPDEWAVDKDRSDFDLASAGSAPLARATPRFFAARQGTGAVDACAEDLAGGGVELPSCRAVC